MSKYHGIDAAVAGLRAGLGLPANQENPVTECAHGVFDASACPVCMNDLIAAQSVRIAELEAELEGLRHDAQYPRD